MFLVSKCLSNPYVVITQLFLICFPHHLGTCNRLETARETPEPCACMYVLFFFTSVCVGMQIISWALNIYCKVNLDCTCYSTLGYAMYMFDEGLYFSLLSHRKEKNPWKHLKNKAYLLKHRRWHPLFHHLYILNCQFKYLVQWCILKTNEHS